MVDTVVGLETTPIYTYIYIYGRTNYDVPAMTGPTEMIDGHSTRSSDGDVDGGEGSAVD